MRSNRYPGKCCVCRVRVKARGGRLERINGEWVIFHLPCWDSGAPAVDVFQFSSGQTHYRNKRGRCIDAPCCGCCTIEISVQELQRLGILMVSAQNTLRNSGDPTVWAANSILDGAIDAIKAHLHHTQHAVINEAIAV